MTTPQLFSRSLTNRPENIGGELGLDNGSNTFNAHTFVVLTAGVLAAVATGGTSSCGLVPDVSQPSGTLPTMPYIPFGTKHFPYALPGQRFTVSVTDSSGHVGQANSAPQLSAITKGSSYGIIKLGNGNHALNVSDTSNLFFTVVDIPSQWGGTAQTSATYNPVVIVEVVAAAQQKIG